MAWRDVMRSFGVYTPDAGEARALPAGETRSLEDPRMSLSTASSEELLAFFGISQSGAKLPPVTIDSALEVPAVFGIVNFLSSTMASLPLHAHSDTAKIDGELAMLLNEAPNPDWTSFDWRKYIWTGFLTGGRGLSWIERAGKVGSKVLAIWPMNPAETVILRKNGRKIYRYEGRDYPAEDVIDLPFLLKPDGLGSYGPVWKARKAIALALAMADFAGNFFSSGGLPPLALQGPLPSGPDAMRRAGSDIQRTIDLAKKSGSPFFGMPPGHELKPIGIEPAKGQMVEARAFQILEIARTWGMPPAFVQDLSNGTFSNTEQQDLQLVKHKVLHLARQLEDELNLKLFGQRRRSRKVKHNLDGLQRGDFKTRMDALGRAIQTAQITPNEARALEEREPLPKGDDLLVQGATVPLGQQPLKPATNSTDPTKDSADGGTDD